jgi:hypothetical protein
MGFRDGRAPVGSPIKKDESWVTSVGPSLLRRGATSVKNEGLEAEKSPKTLLEDSLLVIVAYC